MLQTLWTAAAAGELDPVNATTRADGTSGGEGSKRRGHLRDRLIHGYVADDHYFDRCGC